MQHNTSYSAVKTLPRRVDLMFSEQIVDWQCIQISHGLDLQKFHEQLFIDNTSNIWQEPDPQEYLASHTS